MPIDDQKPIETRQRKLTGKCTMKSTPRKDKSRAQETNLHQLSPVTPPKQQKTIKSPTTPSTLLRKLSLSESNENLGEDSSETRTIYQNARRALHGTAPSSMPGRERELEELRGFLEEHLEQAKSGTVYVSGPPGTGKTAALTSVLNDKKVSALCRKVYVNCTSIKSSKAIFARIVKDLDINANGRSEKDCVRAIESYLSQNHKMILLVLDEIDQLESKNQSILYTIFEWPAKPSSRTILIGIANALDLTDRILPRLQARCSLKPKLMHFAPYSKREIVEILSERLKEAGVSKLFDSAAIQMLAGKVAAVSGDVRRALDIGRRVIELAERNRKQNPLQSLDNEDGVRPIETNHQVEWKHVLSVLNEVYGTTNNLDRDGAEDAFPLQQKIVLCTLLLILQKAKNKDVTIGRLHDAYKKVCSKRNILAVDQAEFVGLCSLIETRGILRVSGKREPRMHKVSLEWNQEEVTAVLNDKKLLSGILQDDVLSGKL